MTKKELQKLIEKGGFLCLNKRLINKLGLETAYFLTNLMEWHCYYSEKEWLDSSEGFYYTSAKIQETIQFSRWKQEQCIAELKGRGLLITIVKGLPAKTFYYLQWKEIIALIDPPTMEGVGENVSLRETGKLDSLQENSAPVCEKLTNIIYNKNKVLNNCPHNKNNEEQPKRSTRTLPNLPPDEPVKTKKEEQIDQCLPIAEKLKQVVTSKSRIKIKPSQVYSWASQIRLLWVSDRINIARIERAVNWYMENYEDEYTPVIESGNSLRDKFIRLEAAMERSKKAIRKQAPSKPAPYTLPLNECDEQEYHDRMMEFFASPVR